MEVYRRALEFVKFADEIRPVILSRRAALAEQMDRASDSIVLNIAEGAGEFARREKARFYRMARRSATECAGILDIVRELGLVDDFKIERGKQQLLTIVAMLTGLVKHCDHSSRS